jgi:molybdopterin-guanine dinucleotide biosynthesis protein A
MRTGAIILCGGKSSRMGRDKASLPFGPELMLERVVRLVGEVVPQVNTVVVAGVNQLLPELPAKLLIARDTDEYRGPLAGLATGLRTLGDRVDAVYASGCDVPLLVPAFIVQMFNMLGDYDAAVPVDGDHHHALAAVYRPVVLPRIDTLLQADRLRSRFLFDEVRTREISVDELRDIDPQLRSLQNVNREEDYLAALARAGLIDSSQTG